jgi:hypothetical protein
MIKQISSNYTDIRFCYVMLDLKFQRFGKCTLKADHKAPTHIEFSPNYLDLVVELADLQLIARSN